MQFGINMQEIYMKKSDDECRIPIFGNIPGFSFRFAEFIFRLSEKHLQFSEHFILFSEYDIPGFARLKGITFRRITDKGY